MKNKRCLRGQRMLAAILEKHFSPDMSSTSYSESSIGCDDFFRFLIMNTINERNEAVYWIRVACKIVIVFRIVRLT